MRRVIRSTRFRHFLAVAILLTVPTFGCGSDPTEPECEADECAEDSDGSEEGEEFDRFIGPPSPAPPPPVVKAAAGG